MDGAGAGVERRTALLRYLCANPGAHFRALQRALSLGPGQADHHLRRLVQEGMVVARPSGGYTFYYAATASPNLRAVHSALRQPTRRAIAVALAGQPLTLTDLAGETGRTVSTLHHHLRVLLAAEAVRVEARRPHRYLLSDEGRRALGLEGS